MRLIKKILAILTVSVALPVSAASYIYDDSATVASTYAWTEIAPTPSTRGTCATSGSTFIKNNNNTMTNISLPFTFNYAGKPYASIVVSSNGFIQLGPTALNGGNTNIPLNNTTAGFVGLFPLWTDFIPPNSMTYVASLNACSGVYYQTIGTAPNRTFILEFNAIPQKNTANAYSTFQVQLKESSNFIVFKYKSIYQQGALATTGIIMNNTLVPKDLIQYSYNTTALPAGRTILYRPASYLDHYEIEFSPDNTGLTCNPKQVKVRACTSPNSPCVNAAEQATTSSTVNLTSTLGTWGGTTSGSQSLTFTGSGSTTLNSTAAGNATISMPTSSPTPFGALKCYSGSTLLSSCSNTFVSTGLIFNWATNQQTSTFDAVLNAGATSNVVQLKAVQACTGSFNQNTTTNVNFNISYFDPALGTRNAQITPTNNLGAGATAYTVGTANASVPMTFDATGTAYFRFRYIDAGKITLSASVNSPAASGKGTIISKPYTLKAYSSASEVVCANGNILNSNTSLKFCPASENFTTKVRAYAIDGTTNLPNFGKESVLSGIIMSGSLKSPAGKNSGNIQSSFTGNSAILETGVDVGKNYICNGSDCYLSATLDWNEVGEIYLTPNVSDDNYFGTGPLALKTPLPVGRFYPYSLSLNSASIINRSKLTCSSTPEFNYMGEQFDALINLSAQNKDGINVQNYDGSMLNTNSGSSWNISALLGANNLTTRVEFISGASTWSNGSSDISLGLTLNRSTLPDGPYNNVTLGLSPIDADGVTLKTYDLDLNNDGVDEAALIGNTNFYFGRMKINNATGSELLRMAIPIEVQYFNGAGFTTNTNDNCTSLIGTNFSTNNFTQNLTSPEISFSYPNVFINGKQTIIMNKPSSGDSVYNGSFDLNYNLNTNSQTYLLGKWTGTTYSDNPKAKIILSRQTSKSRVIFVKDNY